MLPDAFVTCVPDRAECVPHSAPNCLIELSLSVH